MMYFQSSLGELKSRVENRIHKVIIGQGQHEPLCKAMMYATQGGGKYLRSYLMMQFYLLCNQDAINDNDMIDTCVALELIHSYSLVHDDLPAMDNGMFRRGRPSCWVAYDDATAILVGDALLTLSFEVLSQLSHVSDHLKIQLVQLFAQASGANGMIAGQMMDLFPGDHSQISGEKITIMQSLKTGKLFAAACEAGTILANRAELRGEARNFGEKFGLLFQMTDDLLDMFGDQKSAGKTVNHDHEKVTFISAFGLESVRTMVENLNHNLQLQICEKFSGHQNLDYLLEMIVNREGIQAAG